MPASRIFEDIQPRVADLDGDGRHEVVVVESAQGQGAQLAVYGLRNGALVKLAATPHIGTQNRWLAPVGIGDLDGDGAVEIAYVETPHLGKRLRVWRWTNGRLVEVARARGLTNHRIGDPVIWGGLRDCGAGLRMILASGDWRRVLAVRLSDGALSFEDLGALAAPVDLNRHLAC